MGKKKIIIALGAGLIIAIGVLFIFLKPSPDGFVKKYIEHWNKKEYSQMYKLLSEDAKKKYTEENFITKYKNIDGGIKLTKVEIKSIDKGNIKKLEGKTVVPYTLVMETGAGSVEFQYKMVLSKSGMGYKVDWQESVIFPQMAVGDKVKVRTVVGKRGEILDIKGRKLAENGEVYEVGLVPGKFQDKDLVKKQLSELTGVDPEYIEKQLQQKWATEGQFVPIYKFPMTDTDKKNNLLKISGVKLRNMPSRIYPYGEKAAHLTGYIGNIGKEDYEKLKSEGYRESDKIGISGLERSFEKRLRASDGMEIIIEGAKGESKDTIKYREAKDGETIKLTINIDIQSKMFDELKGDSGAATAINPQTGEVLALVSTPSYDPNKFVLGISDSEYKALNENPKKPLMSKFSSPYVPGSTFKPITAAIGLKTGKLKSGDTMDVKGLEWQDNPSWGGYKVSRVKDIGKPVNLRDAIVYSDNIYFAKAALDIGGENFAKEAKEFGIGEEISFPLNIGTSKLTDKEGFGGGRSIRLADTGYGQGQVLISPFQLAFMYTPFLKDGSMISPVIEDKGEKGKVWRDKVISPEIAQTIQRDLVEVVQSPGGTGNEAKINGATLGGKTGTAEIKGGKEDTTGTELGWFTLFNTKKPDVLITMMIEDVKNRGGSHYVVPRVKRVMEEALK